MRDDRILVTRGSGHSKERLDETKSNRILAAKQTLTKFTNYIIIVHVLVVPIVALEISAANWPTVSRFVFAALTRACWHGWRGGLLGRLWKRDSGTTETSAPVSILKLTSGPRSWRLTLQAVE